MSNILKTYIMEEKYIIGITFGKHFNERGDVEYYRDSSGLRKPFLFHLPGTNGNLVDSKVGIMFDFCNALAVGNEDPIVLDVIVSDKSEEKKGWVALHDIMKGDYTTLPNYCGENGHGGGHPVCIDFSLIYPSLASKYIYLKKNKSVHLKVPNKFCL